MPEPLKITVSPHPKQWEVIQAMMDPTVTEIWLRKGRRFGGTYAAALSVTDFATKQPFSPGAAGHKPTQIGLFGPIYENAKRVYQELIDSFGPTLQSYRESDLSAVWRGGARCKVFSGENAEAALGYGFDIVAVDEASNFSKQAIETYIKPALADRGGRIWYVSSPRHGTLNHFAQGCLRAEAATSPRIRAFHGTTYDNPHVPRWWIDDQKASVDELTFQEEYLALILDSSAGWLDPSHIQRIPAKQIPGNTFNVLLSDFAWAKPEPGMVDATTRRRKDANVLAVVSQDLLGNVYLREKGLYEKYLEPDDAFAAASDLIRKYDVKKFVVEREVNVHRSTDDMFGRLWRAYADKHRVPTVGMVRPQRTSKWKVPAIRRWSVLLNRNKFFIEEGSILDSPLTSEMMTYSETASANDTCHDDVLVAMSDIMLPGVYQGRNENEAPFAGSAATDHYHLREAWAWSRGDHSNEGPRKSRYSIL